ncbi:hypothetical protein J132_08484 [Termitomyces sp. J132]|nr:hypothetical protein H2248_006316 [Termitomyces sp. 'cryptogamus']KNZ79826.1 hypothetical protein J132_08484 [Termitomyces sp. J132]
MVQQRLGTTNTSPTHALSKLYKAAATTPLPTRDDILSLLLHPSTTPSDHQTITALLHAASAVSRLPSFRALQLSDTTPRHCVRCHASYTDARNTRGACIVPQENMYATRRVERFVSEIEDTRARLGSGAFYRGYHTEDVDEVEAEGGYNGTTLRRCDKGMCMW